MLRKKLNAIRFRKNIALCGVVLGICVSVPPSFAAPILTFTPADPHINVGDSVEINATISGLGPEILSAYDLNFTYNGTLLNWTVITQYLAPFSVNNSPTSSFDQNIQGDLGFLMQTNDTDADLAANQPDSFLLLSFTLKGLADGATIFTLGPDPKDDREFIGLRQTALDVSVGSTCISVGTGTCAAAAPAPGALLLTLLGLPMIAVGRRRCRTSQDGPH